MLGRDSYLLVDSKFCTCLLDHCSTSRLALGSTGWLVVICHHAQKSNKSKWSIRLLLSLPLFLSECGSQLSLSPFCDEALSYFSCLYILGLPSAVKDSTTD